MLTVCVLLHLCSMFPTTLCDAAWTQLNSLLNLRWCAFSYVRNECIRSFFSLCLSSTWCHGKLCTARCCSHNNNSYWSFFIINKLMHAVDGDVNIPCVFLWWCCFDFGITLDCSFWHKKTGTTTHKCYQHEILLYMTKKNSIKTAWIHLITFRYTHVLIRIVIEVNKTK